jgi:hypothetical protein
VTDTPRVIKTGTTSASTKIRISSGFTNRHTACSWQAIDYQCTGVGVLFLSCSMAFVIARPYSRTKRHYCSLHASRYPGPLLPLDRHKIVPPFCAVYRLHGSIISWMPTSLLIESCQLPAHQSSIRLLNRSMIVQSLVRPSRSSPILEAGCGPPWVGTGIRFPSTLSRQMVRLCEGVWAECLPPPCSAVRRTRTRRRGFGS